MAAHRLRLLVLLAAFALLAASCGDDGEAAAVDPGDGLGEPALAGDITVSAAASLTEAFTAIGEAFEAAHPGTSVTFNFGASSTLVRQINEGASADVFASADQANMKKLTDAANAAGEPVVFATNRLQIITAAGNPKGITTVADLADPELVVVTCGEDVPVGRYAAEVFSKAGVTVTPKSYEADVKAVVNKVTLGEADAGVVYATDVKAAGSKATGIDIPDDVNVIATYPIAMTKAAGNRAVADAFVAFVLSDEGQSILADAGFGSP
ncbi:MAG TPA: molybdate ABC transporter substrate-binding protein [Acidimicrobiales bacterium]